MEHDALLSAISLCRKAGALTVGFDPVKDAVFAGRAALVLLAADLSQGSARRMRQLCEGLVPCSPLPLTMEQLSAVTRKPAGVLAVTDENLARLCKGKLPVQKEEYNGNQI